MKGFQPIRLIAFISALILATLACGFSPATTAPASRQPSAPIAPIRLGSDLTQIDVCGAIPQEDVEAVMGRKLSKAPQHYVYDDNAGESGCSYESNKDASGEAHFGYIVFTSVATYNSQPLYQNIDVSGFGQKAYFNNGADARQLWVEVNDKTAFMIAFGDVPIEEGSKALAKLLLAAIK